MGDTQWKVLHLSLPLLVTTWKAELDEYQFGEGWWTLQTQTAWLLGRNITQP